MIPTTTQTNSYFSLNCKFSYLTIYYHLSFSGSFPSETIKNINERTYLDMYRKYTFKILQYKNKIYLDSKYFL